MPRRNDEVELVNAVNIAYRRFGTAMGDMYEQKLGGVDPQWLKRLQDERRKVLSLHDPYFVLDEPLRNQDSVTRACLGRRDSVFWDAMERARLARNKWVHSEEKVAIRSASDAIKPILLIASELEFTIREDLGLLLARLQAIAAGNEFVEEVDTARIAELVEEIEAEQVARDEAHDKAAEAFARAQLEYTQRQEVEARAGSLELEVERLELALDDAMEGWGRAVAIADEAAQRRAAEHEAEVRRMRELIPEPLEDVALPEGLVPGDPWPDDLPLGGWDLDLKAAFVDLLVLAGHEFLSELLPDEDVTGFARKCLEVVPDGGLVYVDHCGHVVRDAYPTALEQTYVGTMPREWVKP